jgi:L-ascorbate metabolism protein UlaG (beta-lactamase superfamily)
MPTLRRLTDSCVLLTTDAAATLLDPGFHTFTSGAIDLATIGDVTRVLITHEHRDHIHPEFLAWLLDRRRSLTVHCNQAVADLLAGHDLMASTELPAGVSAEDVTHETTPAGTEPPNRAFTVEGLFTHPGDSYQPTTTAPIMALPLITPWGSAAQAVDFARRLGPARVIPVHDYYLSPSGREFITTMVKGVLEKSGIELLPLDWDQSLSW